MKRIAIILAALMLVGGTQESGAVEKRKVHYTTATKTITVRGGVSYCGPFSGGLACIKTNNKKWFVIDKTGNKLFDIPEGYYPPQAEYDDLKMDVTFDNGRLMIVESLSLSRKNACIINDKGVIVKQFKNIWAASPLLNGLAILQMPKGYGWEARYIDSDGNIVPCNAPVIQPILQGYCTVFRLKEGRRLFFDEKKKMFGYMDEKCNIVIPARFKSAYTFSQGVAKVQNNEDLWGFIDKNGAYVIEPTYTNEPTNFNYLHAMVTDKRGVQYIINRKGEFLFSNENKTFELMRPHLGHGDKAYAVYEYHGKSFIMDISLQPVAPCNVESLGYLADFTDNYFLWSDCNACTSKKWMYDWQGNELMVYWGTKFSEGLASLSIQEYNGMGGYINEYGEVIVKFQDTQF